MAIVHDLAESIIGDIAPGDNVSKEEKQKMEHEAISFISKLLARATNTTGNLSNSSEEGNSAETRASRRLLSIIEEYEQRQSEEAIAVKDLDLLDMIIQADEYERAHPQVDLQDFFDGTRVERFNNAAIRSIAEEVHRQRSQRNELEIIISRHEVRGLVDARGKSTLAKVQLSKDDVAFAEDFGETSGMSTEDVEKVVRALRKHDAAKLRK